MTDWPEDHEVMSSLLPGRPDDYLGTVVVHDDLLACLEERAGIAALLNDAVPLPRTEARDGHSKDRHLEYWLTGFQDARSVRQALGLDPDRQQSILGLEYAGCGRVARHIARDLPKTRLFFGASHQDQVRFMDASFGDRVRAFKGASFPHLPFADASLDGVFAFSVLPSSLEACAWLLEIRRILKPRARLYATVEDEESWSMLSLLPAGALRVLSDGPFQLRVSNLPCTEAGALAETTASHYGAFEDASAQQIDSVTPMGARVGRSNLNSATPEQSPLFSRSPLLSMFMRVFRIEAIEARLNDNEIGVVFRA